MEEKRCENNFLEPVLGNLQFSRARFGQLTKNLGYRAALLNMLLLPPGGGTSSNNDDFLRPRGDRAGDEIEGQLKKKRKKKKTKWKRFSTFLWCCVSMTTTFTTWLKSRAPVVQ